MTVHEKALESARSRQIRETNERVSRENSQMVAKGRHERKHGKGHKTTLAERLQTMRDFSKD
jgi:hypothetical protein